MATHDCRISATLFIKDGVEEERVKELMAPYLATQGTTYEAELEKGHLEFDDGTFHLDMPVTGRGGYRNEPMKALAASFNQVVEKPDWIVFRDIDAAGSDGDVTPYFIGAEDPDKIRARVDYGIEQMEPWVKPLIGDHHWTVLNGLIHKAPHLVDFLEMMSRMTTDEEMDGDMSGDDAVTALSSLIESARNLLGKQQETPACA